MLYISYLRDAVQLKHSHIGVYDGRNAPVMKEIQVSG